MKHILVTQAWEGRWTPLYEAYSGDSGLGRDPLYETRVDMISCTLCVLLTKVVYCIYICTCTL